jgi:hypothetical protein
MEVFAILLEDITARGQSFVDLPCRIIRPATHGSSVRVQTPYQPSSSSCQW